jgi:hypothetical protein
MRRTIGLTENDLSRILKKVLSENLNNKTKDFLKSIDYDSDGDYYDWDGTDYALMLSTLKSIKTISEYQTINNEVVNKTKKNIIYWVNSETSGQSRDVLLCRLQMLGANGTGKTKEYCGQYVYNNVSCNALFKTKEGIRGMEDLKVKAKDNGFALYTQLFDNYVCTI